MHVSYIPYALVSRYAVYKIENGERRLLLLLLLAAVVVVLNVRLHIIPLLIFFPTSADWFTLAVRKYYGTVCFFGEFLRYAIYTLTDTPTHHTEWQYVGW